MVSVEEGEREGRLCVALGVPVTPRVCDTLGVALPLPPALLALWVRERDRLTVGEVEREREMEKEREGEGDTVEVALGQGEALSVARLLWEYGAVAEPKEAALGQGEALGVREAAPLALTQALTVPLRVPPSASPPAAAPSLAVVLGLCDAEREREGEVEEETQWEAVRAARGEVEVEGEKEREAVALTLGEMRAELLGVGVLWGVEEEVGEAERHCVTLGEREALPVLQVVRVEESELEGELEVEGEPLGRAVRVAQGVALRLSHRLKEEVTEGVLETLRVREPVVHPEAVLLTLGNTLALLVCEGVGEVLAQGDTVRVTVLEREGRGGVALPLGQAEAEVVAEVQLEDVEERVEVIVGVALTVMEAELDRVVEALTQVVGVPQGEGEGVEEALGEREMEGEGVVEPLREAVGH